MAIVYVATVVTTVLFDVALRNRGYPNASRYIAILLLAVFIAALIKLRPRRGSTQIEQDVAREFLIERGRWLHVRAADGPPFGDALVPFEPRCYRVIAALRLTSSEKLWWLVFAAIAFVCTGLATRHLPGRTDTLTLAIHRIAFSACAAHTILHLPRIHEFEISPGRLLVRRRWVFGAQSRFVTHLNLRAGTVRIDSRFRALLVDDGMRRLNASLALMSGYKEMLMYLALASGATPGVEGARRVDE